MNHITSRDNNDRPSLGLKVRRETLLILQGEAIHDTLKSLYQGEAAIELPSLLPDWLADAVLSDMRADVGWAEEYWELNAAGNVLPVTEQRFSRSLNSRRFSWNECLKKPQADAFPLRGFLSALVAPQSSQALSAAYGEKVKFKSADIASYLKGHYLRRHSDVFEDRRFGLVWLFGAGWMSGNGGELVIETSSGSSIAIPPKKGTVVAILIPPDYYHQVVPSIDPMIGCATWLAGITIKSMIEDHVS